MGDNDISTPMAISAQDVVFAEATPEQRQLSWQLNGASWARPLTTSQHMEREELLSRTEMARDGGCKYWVLHMKDNPNAIIASCESFHKTVFVRRPRQVNGSSGFAPIRARTFRLSDGVNGVNGVTGANGANVTNGTNGTNGANGAASVIEEAPAYGIASVYTNPEYRRLGMANLLMQKLQEFMDADGAVCSALYSDVGKAFYSQIGWAVFPHSQATLNLLKEGRKLAPDSCCDVKTRYLSRAEIEPLCEVDVADLKARLARIPEDGKTHFAFAPSHAQIEWQLAREEYMARALHGREVKRSGAITADGKSWIYWDRDWKLRQLKVLRIVTTNPESEARRVDHIWALLGAAVAEASEWGLKAVCVWNPDNTTTSGIKATSNAYENDIKIVFTLRDGSIPSLRWQGGGDARRTTVWEDNYYYCWC